MRILSIFMIVSLLICLGIYEANAHNHEHREHKAHVHGAALMNISIEKDEIEADLDIPGADLVGFEGKAKNKEQEASLKKITDLLTKDYQLFTLPQDAGCTVTKRKLDADYDDHGADHSEYEYEIEYKCKNISKISELNINIFRDIPSLKEISVQLITETTQKSAKLSAKETKISLK